MGMRRLEEIARAIVAGGRATSTPVAAVQWAAHAKQRVVVGTLADIAERVRDAKLANPAVILIGEVVRLRDELRWFDRQPLFGKRILVPRAQHQAEASAGVIRQRGAEPVIFPVIELCDPSDRAPLLAAARQVSSFDFVVFTSQNGVERFFAALAEIGRDARAFGEARVAVVGPKTASALWRHGIRADVTAKEYVGEEVARAILSRGAVRRVLIPRAKEAREELPELLAASGAEVEVVTAYETKPVSRERATELQQLFLRDQLDCVMFTSASTVTSLRQLLGDTAQELLARTLVACIGPVTGAALTEAGVRVDVTATEYTIDGLLDAIERHLDP